MASEGSYKAALNTNMDKFVGDLDQQIDMLLPHYYKKEVEDYNFGQKLLRIPVISYGMMSLVTECLYRRSHDISVHDRRTWSWIIGQYRC